MCDEATEMSMTNSRAIEGVFVVRETARRNSPRFVALVTSLGLGTLACLTVAALAEGFPSPVRVAVLLVCAVLVAHREVVFGDETAISLSIVVICSAVVVFHDEA